MERFPWIAAHQRIGPLRFLMIGVWLFGLKFLIDRLVASLVFDRSWSPLNYLIPLESVRVWSSPPGERLFYATMLGIAVPFVVIGVFVTLARLRDARLPRWLTLLFFVPAVNLLFFAALSVIPSGAARASRREAEPPPQPLPFARAIDRAELDYARDEPTRAQRALARLWPKNAIVSVLLAVLVPVPFALLVTYLAVNVFRGYGLGLFIGMPFVLGLVSSVLHGLRVRRSIEQCFGIACLSLLVSGAGMIALAIEGLGCLIMLAPLALPVAIMGGSLGYSLQTSPVANATVERPLFSSVLLLPLLIGGEGLARPTPSVFAVTTHIEIDAPPHVVWQHVVSFSDIPRPSDWIFRIGVAYPVRARIDGQGVCAIRHCEFSTGAFVEPIEVWDEPRLLRFTVAHNPPPMNEWSPFATHPPHLDDFLVAHAGQFRLIELPGNRTRVEGTTWYEHGLWPETYWRLWSDHIIQRIHGRVLEHVKHLSEAT